MFQSWKQDIPAGLVVFLVALPLCLGVASASTGEHTNLMSGIIAGVVGGIVVGIISGSKIGVSGPAAGLITIVLAAIASLGSFNAFLTAVVLSGVFQLFGAFIGAGKIGNFFPSSVIRGMLAAIGLTLILKEIPHAFGYDADFMGDESFLQADGQNTFTEIWIAFQKTSPAAIVITLLSLAVLLLFERPFFQKVALFKVIPGALVVVVMGVLINGFFQWYFPEWVLSEKHLVSLPVSKNMESFFTSFHMPDWEVLTSVKVYTVALTIALIGSLETLLSVEATDKLDPDKRSTPTKRELFAQGMGNIVSGLIGGLPITQVIVRSSANVNAGGKSKIATIFHGLLLLASVLFFAPYLNYIPLSSLAAILILVGYKLAKVSIFQYMYKLGWAQFIPFCVTVLAVLFSDLLKGISIGMLIALSAAVMQKNQRFHSYAAVFVYILSYLVERKFRNNLHVKQEEHQLEIVLLRKVTFLNKARLKAVLLSLKNDSKVKISARKNAEYDQDIVEVLAHFQSVVAIQKNIKVEWQNIQLNHILTH